MMLQQVNTRHLGMSVFPGVSWITPPSAGAGLQGMGDLTIGSTTLTTGQLILIALAAYLILKR